MPELAVREVELAAADGSALCGTWTAPAGGAKAGLACFHGLTLNRAIFKDLAPQMAQAGLGVLALDFRGHGASGGLLREQGFEDQIADVLSAHTFLKDGLGVDPGRRGLLGFSLGGAVAACAAGRLARREALGVPPACLGLWAPLLRTGPWLQARYATYGQPTDGVAKVWDGIAVSERLFSEAVGLDPLAEAVAWDRPLLFIHGGRDRNHPQSASQEAMAERQLAGREAWHYFPSRSGHLFQVPEERKERDRTTVAFFATQLGAL